MSAPTKPKTATEKQAEAIERLRRALQDVQSAAGNVEDYASRAESALDDVTRDPEAPNPECRELALLVLDLHDAEHSGPMRFCAEACRRAEQELL